MKQLRIGDKVIHANKAGIFYVVDPFVDNDGDIKISRHVDRDRARDNYLYTHINNVNTLLTPENAIESELTEFKEKLDSCKFTKLEGI